MKTKDRDKLIDTLAARFEKNPQRHKGVKWADVLKRLEANPDAIDTLGEMESTGGEPDVIGTDRKTGKIIFCDCSPESPAGRRSLCFDKKALDARKANKPKGSAMELAAKMGVELLSESEYRALQELGEFDTRTSSWIATPENIRSLGGALFCDRRFDTVFVYHNGAESYYAARAFRGSLRV
jgi:hypothetical protein